MTPFCRCASFYNAAIDDNSTGTLRRIADIGKVFHRCGVIGGDPWATYRGWTPCHRRCKHKVWCCCDDARCVSSGGQHAKMCTSSNGNHINLLACWISRGVAVVPWEQSADTDLRLVPVCWDCLESVQVECWASWAFLHRSILQKIAKNLSCIQPTSRLAHSSLEIFYHNKFWSVPSVPLLTSRIIVVSNFRLLPVFQWHEESSQHIAVQGEISQFWQKIISFLQRKTEF